MPTRLLHDMPPALLVLEEQDAVDRGAATASGDGVEQVTFTGEGGKEVTVQVAQIRWTSTP